MTDDNSNLVDIPESLEDFKKIFDNPNGELSQAEDTEDDALATDEDEDAPVEEAEDEDEADEAPEEEDEEESEEDEPKPEPEKKQRKQSNYQTRINELTRARHEAERREAMLMERLVALEQARSTGNQPQTEEAKPQGAPKSEDYPLGEYDPQYLLDTANYNIDQKVEARLQQEREAAARAAYEQQVAAQQNALKANWETKLAEAEQENPDIREDIGNLVTTFANVDPNYGEYLATTIMQLENGPAVLEYLSQNIGEAQTIVASGPHAATLMIGKLDAKLARPAVQSEPEKRNKNLSAAAPPPKVNTKGNRGTAPVRGDTSDYAAFKREYFAK